MGIVDEARTLVHGWSGHLDTPTPELRVIEKLIVEVESKQKQIDLALKNMQRSEAPFYLGMRALKGELK